MAYRTRGVQGSVTSWGTGGNFYATLLSRIKPASISADISNPEQNITGLGEGTQSFIAGLGEATAEIQGFAFATPRLANQAAFAISSGYALHVDEWTLTLEAPLAECTPIRTSGTSPTLQWREYCPSDAITWSVTANAGIDDATAISLPTLTTGSAATMTLTYGDDTTDNTLTGSAFLVGVNPQIARGALNRVSLSYRGTGSLTAAGTNSIFGAFTFSSVPLWSEGGTAQGQLVFTAAPGRTYTCADTIWERITVTARMGQPIAVTIGVRVTGAVTVA